MLEGRRDYLDQCPRCLSEMCVSEGYYGSTLAWFYHFCQDCRYCAEGELIEDDQGILEMRTKEYYAKKAQ